ncbi:TetR/AcrR family transcriptional regulator [Streptomyces sp. NPDC055092]
MAEQDGERARIIEAAYRVLAASEGESVAVGEILTEAGLSTRAFYRHFESKDDLVIAMFRRDNERVMAEIHAMVAAAESPDDALRRFVEGTMRLASDRRRRRRVMVMTSAQAVRARGYAAERARSQAAQESVLALVLEQGRDAGLFPWARAPKADARSICAVLWHVFGEQIAGGGSTGADEAAAQVVDFALRALGAPPADAGLPVPEAAGKRTARV